MSLERLPLIYSPMGHAAGRRTPLRWRPAALILTLSLLPLAAVSLADPPWIAGVYDGGDCDDLLALCFDSESPGAPLAAVPRPRPALGVLAVADTAGSPCESCSALPIRSPPRP